MSRDPSPSSKPVRLNGVKGMNDLLPCPLYTFDAADDLTRFELGCRRVFITKPEQSMIRKKLIIESKLNT